MSAVMVMWHVVADCLWTTEIAGKARTPMVEPIDYRFNYVVGVNGRRGRRLGGRAEERK